MKTRPPPRDQDQEKTLTKTSRNRKSPPKCRMKDFLRRNISLNILNQIKVMSFKVEKKENTKKEFAEFFGTIMPHLNKLKLGGHLLSGLTEAITIYQVLDSNLNQFVQYGLIALSLLITLLIVFLIEGGISRFFPLYVRQIISLRFKNKWWVAMFGAMSVLILPLIFFSPYLSAYGGQFIVKHFTPTVERTNVDTLRQNYIAQKDSIRLFFEAQKSESNQNLDQQIASIKSKYKSLVNVQNGIYNEYKKKLNNGHDWAIGHMNKATRKVKEYEVQKSEELAAIEQKRTLTLEALNTKSIAAIDTINVAESRDVGIIDSEDENRINERSEYVNLWGGFLFVIALMASVLVFLCITIQQIYHQGAGHPVALQEWNDEPSKLSTLKSILGRKFDFAFDSVLSKLESNWSQKNRRKIGFNSDSKSQNNPTKKSVQGFDSQENALTHESNMSQNESEEKVKMKVNNIVITNNDWYNITNWWKRSNDKSIKKATRERNKAKFDNLKNQYEALGLKVKTPTKTTVKITS